MDYTTLFPESKEGQDQPPKRMQSLYEVYQQVVDGRVVAHLSRMARSRLLWWRKRSKHASCISIDLELIELQSLPYPAYLYHYLDFLGALQVFYCQKCCHLYLSAWETRGKARIVEA